jgi:hypothetical protein
MSILGDLIILVKETLDEVNERNQPQPRPTAGAPIERSEEQIEALRRTIARRAAAQQLAHEQADAQAAAEQHAEHERLRHHQVAERERQRQKAAQAPAKVSTHAGTVDAHRIIRLIRQPTVLRELIVLKEILDKPRALRRR